jgi:hypothetical protein
MPASILEERVRVRMVLLDLVNEKLVAVVTECAKRVPPRDVAAYIEGSERKALRVVAGPRAYIAKQVRDFDPRPEIAAQADALLNAPHNGLMPCAFVVHVDVSIMALKMDLVH